MKILTRSTTCPPGSPGSSMRLTPILDDATDVMDLMEELAGQMDDVIDKAREAGDLPPMWQTSLRMHGRLELRCPALRDAVEHLRTALAHLGNVLGKPEHTAEAIQAVTDAAVQVMDSLSEASARL